MNKKIIVSVTSTILVILLIVIGSLWIKAYNGARKAKHIVSQEKTKIYTAYSGRYDKVIIYINAIEGANAQLNTQIEAIMAARTAFANALGRMNYDEAEEKTEIINSTFVNLYSYMEDNPSSYLTVDLTEDFMMELFAATN